MLNSCNHFVFPEGERPRGEEGMLLFWCNDDTPIAVAVFEGLGGVWC